MEPARRWITTWVDGIGGGGVQALRGGALTIEDCAIADNTAEVGAGVLGPGQADSLVTDTVIRGNDAADTAGGAYFGNGDNWTAEIRDSEITDNTAGCEAGGVEFAVLYDPGTATVSDTLIDGNVVAPTDFDCPGSRHRGGGIYSSVFLTLTAVTISNNVAGDGGGAYVRMPTTADDKTVVSGNSTSEGGTGGGVVVELASSSGEYYFPEQPAAWRYGTIEDNTASYGGGVALDAYGWPGCELTDATVQGNHATVSGGGLWIDATVIKVRNSTISSNTSDGVGGGIGTNDATSGTAVLGNVVITSNTAKVAGGGARVEMNLESEQCDWGTGAADNVPDDVSLYSDEAEVTYDEFGALEDFVCSVSELGLRMNLSSILALLTACGDPGSDAPEPECTTAFFLDADGDGHGLPTVWATACSAPSGYADLERRLRRHERRRPPGRRRDLRRRRRRLRWLDRRGRSRRQRLVRRPGFRRVRRRLQHLDAMRPARGTRRRRGRLRRLRPDRQPRRRRSLRRDRRRLRRARGLARRQPRRRNDVVRRRRRRSLRRPDQPGVRVRAPGRNRRRRPRLRRRRRNGPPERGRSVRHRRQRLRRTDGRRGDRPRARADPLLRRLGRRRTGQQRCGAGRVRGTGRLGPQHRRLRRRRRVRARRGPLVP